MGIEQVSADADGCGDTVDAALVEGSAGVSKMMEAQADNLGQRVFFFKSGNGGVLLVATCTRARGIKVRSAGAC